MRKLSVNRKYTFNGHNDPVYTLEKSNIDRSFFSGAGDGMVVKWDLSNPDNGELIAKLPNSVYGLHYLHQPDILVVGHNYDGVHFIKCDTKEEVASLQFTDAAIFDIKSYEDRLYVGDAKGILHILSLNPLKQIDKLSLSEKSIRSIAVSVHNNVIAVGTSDNIIQIIDLKSHQLIQTIEAHTNSVFTLQFTPDQNYLMSAGRDAHLKIWDIRAGYLLIEDIVAHMYAINNIAFSPDGKHFVTCSMDKSIKVWHTESMKLLKVIDKARHAGHGTSVNKLLWSSHENLLISASDDRSISIWEIEF